MPSRPEPDPPCLAPRRVGRYVLFGEIARGGMASVHLARLVGAAGFSRVVAVKRVRSVFAKSEEHAHALRAEAKLTSRIRHPNVVPTLDVILDGGVFHVVMEYVHGATLAELVAEAAQRGEAVPHAIVAGVVIDALQGLHAAHETRDARGVPLGVVHRDVSPQNVIVGADGLARMLDFGVAKALDHTVVTEPGVVKGKVAYMPREQLAGGPVTRQADVYAAGVVLWELLARRRLFEETDAFHVAARLVTEAVPPPSLHAPEVPAALDQVVLRATAHDPRLRYETAGEMLAALALASPRAEAHEIGAWVERLAGDQLELRAEAVRVAESADLDAVPSVTSSAAPVALTRRRAPFVVAVAGLLAIAAASGIALVRRAPAAPAPAAAVAAPVDLADPLPVTIASDVGTLERPAGPVAGEVAKPRDPIAAPRARASKHRISAACDPPFSIDESGRKQYKPECLR
jgi:tRNA A-37 threonylcarbamoyl transferase component Bud32